MSRCVGIIGFGTISQDLVAILAAQADPPRMVVLVRPGREETTAESLTSEALSAEVQVEGDVDEFLAAAPGVVAECAGHGAVAELGTRILETGADLIVASVGALADVARLDALKEAARRGGGQLIVPSGAIGGIDALSAARLSGLTSVRYTGRKPPAAWAGTLAEEVGDLARMDTPTTIFTGSARAAAQAFPKNANVAATLALAGLGMDETEVTLVADPTTAENVHEFSISSPAVEASVRLVGKPSPRNPKTSQTTVLSIARAVLNRDSAIVV